MAILTDEELGIGVPSKPQTTFSDEDLGLSTTAKLGSLAPNPPADHGALLSGVASAFNSEFNTALDVVSPFTHAAGKLLGRSPEQIGHLNQTARDVYSELAPASPNHPVANTVGRTIGGAVPVVAATALGGPFAGAAVGASQGLGSGIDEGAAKGYSASATTAVAAERAAFNGILGLIPGGKSAGSVVKEGLKAGAEVVGTNVAQAAVENEVKKHFGISDESTWDSIKNAAKSGETWAQALIFGGVRAVVSGAKGAPKTEEAPKLAAEHESQGPIHFDKVPQPIAEFGEHAKVYPDFESARKVMQTNPDYGAMELRDGSFLVAKGLSRSVVPSDAANRAFVGPPELVGPPKPEVKPQPIDPFFKGPERPVLDTRGLTPPKPVVPEEAQSVPIPVQEVRQPAPAFELKYKPPEYVPPERERTAQPKPELGKLPSSEPKPAPGSVGDRQSIPDYIKEEMVRQGKNPDRMMNEVDAAQMQKQLRSDPLHSWLEKTNQKEADRFLKGDFSRKQYTEATAKMKSEQPAPHIVRLQELAKTLVENVNRGDKLLEDQRSGVANKGEAHDELGRINKVNRELYFEAEQILKDNFGDARPSHIFGFLEQLHKESTKIDLQGQRKSAGPSQRSGGFVDFSPIIDGALKTGKWLGHHTAIAADWVMRKFGNVGEGVRKILVERFGGRIKPHVAEVENLVKSESRKSVTQLPWRSLTERLESAAPSEGSITAMTAQRVRSVENNMKAGLGEDTPIYDRAIKAATKLFGKGAIDKNAVQNIPGTRGFVENARVALEPGNYKDFKAPDSIKDFTNVLQEANIALGQHAEGVIDGFRATGKMQRLATFQLVEAIKRGSGEVFNGYVDTLHALNPSTARGDIIQRLEQVREHLLADRYDAAYRLISQEHTRVFDRVPSGMYVGKTKQPVWFYHDAPADYLRTARERVLGRVAYLKEFGKDNITELRQQIDRETNGGGAAFMDTIKAIHGLPTDGLARDPSSVVSQANRALQAVQRIATAASTVGATPLNVIEPFTGQNLAVFGPKWVAKGLAYIKENGVQGLENAGKVDRAFMDMSIDQKSPVRTILRITRNVLATPNYLANEFGEISAAATAQTMIEQAKAQKLSAGDQRRLQYGAKLFGFSKADALALGNGTASAEVYDAFARKAASTLTSGNIRATERSALENNRFFQQWFPFMSYPAMTLRLMDNSAREAFSALKGTDNAYKRTAVAGFARIWGGVAVRGEMVHLLGSILSGGLSGLKISAQEDAEKVTEEPVQFLAGLFAKGVGGPLTMIAQLANSDNPTDVAQYSYRAKLVQDILSSVTGVGDYKDLSKWDRAVKFADRRFPAARIPTTWWSIVGLGEANVPLDQAQSGFYRWKRDEGIETSITSGGEEVNVEFRHIMRQAAKMIEQNQDPSEYLQSNIPELKAGAPLASSLRARRMLAGLPNDLPKEKLDALKRRLGDDGYKRLIDFDDLLSAWADQYDRAQTVGARRGTDAAKKLITSPSPERLEGLKNKAGRERVLQERKNEIRSKQLSGS